jgi:hypothetical protein
MKRQFAALLAFAYTRLSALKTHEPVQVLVPAMQSAPPMRRGLLRAADSVSKLPPPHSNPAGKAAQFFIDEREQLLGGAWLYAEITAEP